MNIRAICEGQFTLPLAPAAALPLFTPRGRAPLGGLDWDPRYAIQYGDDSDTGTVFTIESDDATAVWIVLDRRADGMRYARVTPGRIAGTITVTCAQEAATDETSVTVRYDVTSIGPKSMPFVQAFEAGYDAFLGEWREEILAGLAGEAGAR